MMIDEYLSVLTICKEVFINKFKDYKDSWKVLRPNSVADQIFIKGQRVRQIEGSGVNKVGETAFEEYIGIANYAIIGLMIGGRECKKKEKEEEENWDTQTAVQCYEHYAEKATKLLGAKNHDYSDAWRQIDMTTITDIVLMKVLRLKNIYKNNGVVGASEGPDANFLDIFNYALFYLIRYKDEGKKA